MESRLPIIRCAFTMEKSSNQVSSYEMLDNVGIHKAWEILDAQIAQDAKKELAEEEANKEEARQVKG